MENFSYDYRIIEVFFEESESCFYVESRKNTVVDGYLECSGKFSRDRESPKYSFDKALEEVKRLKRHHVIAKRVVWGESDAECEECVPDITVKTFKESLRPREGFPRCREETASEKRVAHSPETKAKISTANVTQTD